MRNIAVLLILSILSVFTANAVEEARTKRSIHGILGVASVDLADYVDLILDDRMADSISIEGGHTMMSFLSVKCNGTSLKITYPGITKEDAARYSHVVVRMSPQTLRNLRVRSNSSVVLARPLTLNSLNCDFGPGCRVKGTLKIKHLKINFREGCYYNGSLFCKDVSISLLDAAKFGINGGSCESLTLYCDGKAQFITDKFTPSKSFNCTARDNTIVHMPASSSTSISLSGDARYEGSVKCSTLILSLADRTIANISGTTSTLHLSIAGSCHFSSPKLEVVSSAVVTSWENSFAEVRSTGNVTVRASDKSTVRIPECDGSLSISASGTSRVSYRKNSKIESMKIKDQASTDIFN